MLLIDSSWEGLGGIGRFSSEIIKRLSCKLVRFNRHPASVYSFLSNSYISYSKAGCLFFPGYIPPFFTNIPFVFTMHDLNHIDRNEGVSYIKKIFYNIVVRRGCYRAKAILTVSDFSKNRIVSWSGIAQEKVINVGNGVDQGFSTSVAPFLPGYRYLLCVGNRKRHKNEARALLAYSKALIANDIKLVFSGDISDELKFMIDEHQLAERIVFLGKISEDALPSVYRGALGLLFPSLYEGFGLPVVEAMACGVPVLTSNTTSLPEVAGDAALLVNPESVDEIRVGIERLVHDEVLRTELITKGLERAKLFSWDAVAARVQAVLDEVANQHAK